MIEDVKSQPAPNVVKYMESYDPLYDFLDVFSEKNKILCMKMIFPVFAGRGLVSQIYYQ